MLGRVGSTLQKLKDGLPSGPGVSPPGPFGDEKKLAEVKTVLQRLQRIGNEPEREPIDQPIVRKGSRSASRKPFLLVAITGGALLFVGAGGVLLWSLAPSAFNLTLGKDPRNAPPPLASTVLNPAPGEPNANPQQFALNKDQPSAALTAKPSVLSPPTPQEGSQVQPTTGGGQQTAAPPATSSILPSSGDASQLAEADILMDQGQVGKARRLLESMAAESPEAALMLARSYDPNYLRTIPSPDAGPDPRQAEHWYRLWHESASGKGLVMEPERLDRIIRAMR